jgi:hypothetical protein
VSSIRSTARRRRCTLAACLALSPLASLTACSGEAEQEPEQPRLPAAVADELAAHSDRVAELLAAGDQCGAAHAADELQGATLEAINRGDVPAPFQEELTASAGALVDEVNCPPPPPPQDDEADDDDGDDDGKSKGKEDKKKE